MIGCNDRIHVMYVLLNVHLIITHRLLEAELFEEPASSLKDQMKA